ncbi:MAG: DUF1345 domain-containing protein [Chitinophagaceae bacterium]
MKRIIHMHSIYKLFAALIIAVAAILCTYSCQMALLVRLMIGWDVFCFVYLSISWLIFFNAKTESIRLIASNQDTRSYLVFLIVCISIVSSIVTILLLIMHSTSWGISKLFVTAVYILGVIGSWTLLNTIFAFHYAHMFYGDPKKHQVTGGLEFPGKQLPDYIDFAYFAFTIGMTFQVSDIVISSSRIRRFALMHSVLSFGFNTVIVALSVNALVNM